MSTSTLLFSSPKWILIVALLNKSFWSSKSSYRSKAGQQRFRQYGLIYCWLVLRNRQSSVVLLADSKCWGNVLVPLSCRCWFAALTALILGWDRRSFLKNPSCNPPVPSDLAIWGLYNYRPWRFVLLNYCPFCFQVRNPNAVTKWKFLSLYYSVFLVIIEFQFCSVLPLFFSDVIIVRGLWLKLIRVTGDSST